MNEICEIAIDELNADEPNAGELTIDELDAVSGGDLLNRMIDRALASVDIVDGMITTHAKTLPPLN
jgi:hypothetical protein